MSTWIDYEHDYYYNVLFSDKLSSYYYPGFKLKSKVFKPYAQLPTTAHERLQQRNLYAVQCCTDCNELMSTLSIDIPSRLPRMEADNLFSALK